MPNRITNNPRTGKGDLGTSNLISGYRIRKSSDICTLQNHISELRNNIANILASGDELPIIHNDQNLLMTIRDQICNNLSASVYYKFDNKTFAIHSDFSAVINQRIQLLSDIVPDAPEFVVFNLSPSLLVEQACTSARSVENYFWKVVDIMYGDFVSDYNETVKGWAEFLNMLSDYIFCINRYMLWHTQQVESYWDNPSNGEIQMHFNPTGEKE